MRIKDLLKTKNSNHHSENTRIASVLRESETLNKELLERCRRFGVDVSDVNLSANTGGVNGQGNNGTSNDDDDDFYTDEEVEEMERSRPKLFEKHVLDQMMMSETPQTQHPAVAAPTTTTTTGKQMSISVADLFSNSNIISQQYAHQFQQHNFQQSSAVAASRLDSLSHGSAPKMQSAAAIEASMAALHNHRHNTIIPHQGH